jgi:hypothetical protein
MTTDDYRERYERLTDEIRAIARDIRERKPMTPEPDKPEKDKAAEPPESLMAEMVRRHTASSIHNIFNRTIDKIAEEIAYDLMREPEFREQLLAATREAFTRAIEELKQPAPPRRLRDW